MISSLLVVERISEASNCQNHQVVPSRDTWRLEGYLLEGDFFWTLHEAGVSNIADLVTPRDAHGSTLKCGDTESIKATLIWRYLHYRHVLDTTGSPLLISVPLEVD